MLNVLSRATGVGRSAVDKGLGLTRSLLRRGPKDLDDVALARKVESIVFRDADVPKGKVDVNVAGGVVQLRGEVKNPATRKAVEARVRAIREVRGVDNLLHLPRTPASTRADAPGRAKRRTTESKEKTPTTRRRRITGEKQAANAEPSPADLAERRAGRQPAPFGSEGGQEET